MDDRQGGQNDKSRLRASDADREEVIERLRAAMEEGRLRPADVTWSVIHT